MVLALANWLTASMAVLRAGLLGACSEPARRLLGAV